MTTQKKKPESKKSWRKPRLRTIDLVAHEVLGVGCKDLSSSAFGASTCIANGCADLGS